MRSKIVRGCRTAIHVGALIATAALCVYPPWKGRVDAGPIHIEFAGPYQWIFTPPRVPPFPAVPQAEPRNPFEKFLAQPTSGASSAQSSGELPDALLLKLERLGFPEFAQTREAARLVSFGVDYGRVLLSVIAIFVVTIAISILFGRDARASTVT